MGALSFDPRTAGKPVRVLMYVRCYVIYVPSNKNLNRHKIRRRFYYNTDVMKHEL